jgi:hypothetical protein
MSAGAVCSGVIGGIGAIIATITETATVGPSVLGIASCNGNLAGGAVVSGTLGAAVSPIFSALTGGAALNALLMAHAALGAAMGGGAACTVSASQFRVITAMLAGGATCFGSLGVPEYFPALAAITPTNVASATITKA